MAKPTVPEIDTTTYPTLRAAIPLHEASPQLPVCLRGDRVNIPAAMWHGYSGSQTGNVAESFVLSDLMAGSLARRFRSGTASFRFVGAGRTNATKPAISTFATVFKPRFPAKPSGGAAGTTNGYPKDIIIFGMYGQTVNNFLQIPTYFGLGILWNADGTLTSSFVRGGAYGAAPARNVFGGTRVSSTLNLSNESWYAAAVSRTGSGSTFFIYDLTAGALVSAAAGTAGAGDATLLWDANVGDLVINPAPINGPAYESFLGDIAHCEYDEQAWDTAKFAAFYADFAHKIRSSYTPGVSALTAGRLSTTADEDNIYLTVSRPTGGASAGVYTQQLHASRTPNFTADGTTLVAGATNKLTVFPANRNEDWYFTTAQSDGTSTVYAPNAAGLAQAVGEVFNGGVRIAILSDSYFGETDISLWMSRGLQSNGYTSEIFNYGKAGSCVYSPTASDSCQPNTTQDPVNGQAGTVRLANFIDQCNKQGITDIYIFLGTNDSAIPNTAANFKMYLQRTIATLKDATFGVVGLTSIRIMAHNMRYDDATRNALLQSYKAKMLELEDGIVTYGGDSLYHATMRDMFAMMRSDGIHLHDNGASVGSGGLLAQSLMIPPRLRKTGI